jgi:2-methylcitrate dehydratase
VDGSATDEVVVDYPVGHVRRRDEGIPLLKIKFERHLREKISASNSEQILALCADQVSFESATVTDMMALLHKPTG